MGFLSSGKATTKEGGKFFLTSERQHRGHVLVWPYHDNTAVDLVDASHLIDILVIGYAEYFLVIFQSKEPFFGVKNGWTSVPLKTTVGCLIDRSEVNH